LQEALDLSLDRLLMMMSVRIHGPVSLVRVATDFGLDGPGSNFCLYGPGISVGIATELQAGRPGVEFQWEREFSPVQTGPGAHPASCTIGTVSFPEVKCGRGVLLTTHPLLVPR